MAAWTFSGYTKGHMVFETSETADPQTQPHIPEEFSLQTSLVVQLAVNVDGKEENQIHATLIQ